MDNLALIAASFVIGVILLDTLLRSLWIPSYYKFGVAIFRASKSVAPDFKVDSWKILSTDDERYFHDMDYKDCGNGLLIVREEITFFFKYGFGKIYYTPVLHAILRHDTASQRLSIQLVPDLIPTIVAVIFFALPFVVCSFFLIANPTQFLPSLMTFLFPLLVVGVLFLISNIQKKRYMRLFELL